MKSNMMNVNKEKYLTPKVSKGTFHVNKSTFTF